MIRLPAEWENQSAVMLTWPHTKTDWADILAEAETTYLNIIDHLLLYTNVILAVDPDIYGYTRKKLDERYQRFIHSLRCFPVASNDTWARDHGPITIEDDSELKLLDFVFNGWGNKFSSALDNEITRQLASQHAFGELGWQQHDFVLEGGAIESDGEGCLITTQQCLLNPNRNGTMNQQTIELELKNTLGAKKILWLENGYLAGDDTDSHIDTLARFAPERQILYVRCDDAEDEHFEALKKMESELRQFTNVTGAPFHLHSLPWPRAKYGREGHRLPATYANFLITNGAVLVPTYHDPADREAIAVVKAAFPGRNVHGIDCSTLIEQHGSLHCITMQIPTSPL